jgi:predicted peptidase
VIAKPLFQDAQIGSAKEDVGHRISFGRRELFKSGLFLAALGAAGVTVAVAADAEVGPEILNVYALSEVTGGGQKVSGVAVEYAESVDAASLSADTFSIGVVPSKRPMIAGNARPGDRLPSDQAPQLREIQHLYTNSSPAIRPDHSNKAGRYVIVELVRDADLSLPSTESDCVVARQLRNISTVTGRSVVADNVRHANVDGTGFNVMVPGLDNWEQGHWFRDDAHSALLEYSIYLPDAFLSPGGDQRAYPLVLAITHSGTSYDGNCAQTLTETCIASIWGLPDVQSLQQCVVITPRYERTTMNDFWEHTPDLENTFRLVEFLLSGGWNFGDPTRENRRDKVLRIDPTRVYCTGWSMGAMSSLWLMAKHPDTFAAGLIIAGQQRPKDLETLAHQKLLILTGSDDVKATPWNEKCVPVWEQAGGKVTRPAELLDASAIFPIERQQALNDVVNGYIQEGGNITFLTFAHVDHMESARKFFYIKAARDWLISQRKL